MLSTVNTEYPSIAFFPIDTGSHKLQEFKRVYFIETPLLPAASMSEINGFHKTLPELTFSINALKTYFGGKCLERIRTELSRIKVSTESTDFLKKTLHVTCHIQGVSN